MSNANTAVKQRKSSGFWGRFTRRFFLCLFTFAILAAAALALALNLVFNGPSPTARDLLTAALSQFRAASWLPGLFLGT